MAATTNWRTATAKSTHATREMAADDVQQQETIEREILSPLWNGGEVWVRERAVVVA